MNLLDTYIVTKNNSDKEAYHKYISNFYNEKFSKLKKEKINLLEIGMLWGDSIKLWDDFFEEAKIYGVDVNNKLKYNFSQKVNLIFDNAYSNNFLNYLYSKNLKFNVIIDDGPHTLESQLFFLNNYTKFLYDENSLIILEDVYPSEFNILKSQFPSYNIIDLRSIVGGEQNSVIFYKEY